MILRKLGKSSLEISEVSFGCMSLGENEKENIFLLHKAQELGINYFDTADLYQHGKNEETLGKAFKDKRDKVIIASKAGNQWRADGSGWDWNPRKDYILSCAENSLKRLQTDYIDLFQLHGGTIEDNIDDTIDAFEILLKQGKIRYYGISSIRPNVILEYVNRSNIVSVMMQYSLLDRRPEESCLQLLHDNHIGVLARGSLAKGLLAGKPSTSYLNFSADEVHNMAQAVKSISGKARTPAQTALHYILANPAISSAVTGIRTKEQLEEVVATPERQLLTEQELETLSLVIPANLYDSHR
jgi:aryl-alcohol dehydrogenase-like predicted oxidoreductase